MTRPLELVAWHEAGHACIYGISHLWNGPKSSSVVYATIKPSRNASGHIYQSGPTSPYTGILINMAGAAGAYLGGFTKGDWKDYEEEGTYSDVYLATQLLSWGILGHLASENEIKRWLTGAYEDALYNLKKNMLMLNIMANELLYKETVEGERIDSIVRYCVRKQWLGEKQVIEEEEFRKLRRIKFFQTQ